MNHVQQLSDLHDTSTLKYRYSYSANIVDGNPGDLKAFAALFTDDASFNVGMG